MLESVRSRVTEIPKVPAQALLSVGTLTSFAWLLLQNKIHPIFVYLLQVYLTFWKEREISKRHAAGVRVMQQVKLTLPMIPDMELTASKTACALGEHIGMSRDKVDEVQMAVVEACINAFEHSRSPDREVHILLQVLGADSQPQGLRIVIRDFGVGFSPDDKIEEQKARVAVGAPRKRGHGLKIINGLMDEVDIESNDEGTTVIMSKMR